MSNQTNRNTQEDFIPMTNKLAIMSAWTTLNNQLVQVEDIAPQPTKFATVDQIVREERRGGQLNRFDEFYIGETERHLEAVVEALGVPGYMSFNDAVNAVNLY